MIIKVRNLLFECTASFLQKKKQFCIEKAIINGIHWYVLNVSFFVTIHYIKTVTRSCTFGGRRLKYSYLFSLQIRCTVFFFSFTFGDVLEECERGER